MTDFPESLPERENVFLVPAGFEGPGEKARKIKVLSAWLPTGKNNGRVVLAIEGVGSISDAEAIAGLDVVVPEGDRLELDAESTYISDLEGCEVYDGDTLIGRVSDVDFPVSSSGARLEEAPPLLEVRSADDEEILIPFVKQYLVSMDLERKRIVLRLPAGLVDVNR
jgi:16S rRNA processing protein RimM